MMTIDLDELARMERKAANLEAEIGMWLGQLQKAHEERDALAARVAELEAALEWIARMAPDVAEYGAPAEAKRALGTK